MIGNGPAVVSATARLQRNRQPRLDFDATSERVPTEKPESLAQEALTDPENTDAGRQQSQLNSSAPPTGQLCLTLSDWLVRDLPQPDFLMGEWASTTSRGLLVSDTGLGKTNLCLALAFAMASGRDFLHWHGGRASRVLYVDGEMSRRLLKSRLADTSRRAGHLVPYTLYVLSSEDLPDMPPLNSEQGQRCFDDLIEKLGAVDFIIFDNVQSLLSGEMIEEVPWRQTLPWIRSLTRRSIGQLWVHHTGHNTTRSYGTKTREWQLDTVILLEALDRADADIAFVLKFTKARERAPHNRGDFQNVTITLEEDKWRTKHDAPRRRKPPSPNGRKFHEALLAAIVAAPAIREAVPHQSATTIQKWTAECVRRGLLDAPTGNNSRALLSKYRLELFAAEWIACDGDLVWPIHQYP